VQQRPVAGMLLPAFRRDCFTGRSSRSYSRLCWQFPAGSMAAMEAQWEGGRRHHGGSPRCFLFDFPVSGSGCCFLLVFGVKLDLFPVVGLRVPAPGSARRASVPGPARVVACVDRKPACWFRMVRSSTLEVLSLEYVTPRRRCQGLVGMDNHEAPCCCANAMASHMEP